MALICNNFLSLLSLFVIKHVNVFLQLAEKLTDVVMKEYFAGVADTPDGWFHTLSEFFVDVIFIILTIETAYRLSKRHLFTRVRSSFYDFNKLLSDYRRIEYVVTVLDNS